jgi:hypothetical protein
MLVTFGLYDKFDFHLLELDQNKIALTKNPDGPHFASFGTSITYEEFENGKLHELILEVYGQEIFDFIKDVSELRKSELMNIQLNTLTQSWENQKDGFIYLLNCDGKLFFYEKINQHENADKKSFPLEQVLIPDAKDLIVEGFGIDVYQDIIQIIKNILLKRMFEA